jgi:hypothetical protein
MPTVIHELYHKYQAKKYTVILYLILAIHLWRQLALEDSADRVTDKAYNWIEDLEKQNTKNRFNELHKKYYGDNYDVNKQEFIDRF